MIEYTRAVGRSTTKKEQRSANTLYQELSFQDNEESEEHEVVTGMWANFLTCIYLICFTVPRCWTREKFYLPNWLFKTTSLL